MEDITLSWPGSMTTEQAKKYLLTSGFVAVELFRQRVAQSETQHQCALSGMKPIKFDEAFSKWWESEETQRRFHYGQFSEQEIAYAAAVFGKDWGQDNPYSD